MKRILSIALLIIFCMTFTVSCYSAPQHDIVVYVTSAGQKYHRENCRYVRGKAIEINLSKAIYDGKMPCKVCHPPTQADLDGLNK